MIKIRTAKSSILFLFLLAILTIVACQKENIEDSSTTVISTGPPIITETSIGDIAGRVIDEANNAVSDATVRLGTIETTTDEQGLFLLRDVELNSQRTYLTVQKEGYFDGSRTFKAVKNTRQNVLVQLLEKTNVGSFSTANATDISVEGATKISFQANGIVDAAGNPYTGTVEVFAKRLDPLADNLGNVMPGNLTGFGADNQAVTLVSYGMLAVELESPSGEALQLAEGKTAQIEYEIPAELLATAPATIPLWHFDEVQGIWLEEGEAIRQGNRYAGEVAHFSFWNWDIPYDKLIELSGVILNKTKDALQRLIVCIRLPNSCAGGYTMSNEDGSFAATVPNNEVLDITIKYETECNGDIVFYSGQIGPFDNSTSLDPIVIDFEAFADQVLVFEATGTLTDCDGNAVFGSVSLVDENGVTVSSFLTTDNGYFSQTIATCQNPTSVSVAAIAESFVAGNSSAMPIAELVDFEMVSLCEDATDEFFIFGSNDLNFAHDLFNTNYRNGFIEYNECEELSFFEVASSQEDDGLIGLIANFEGELEVGTQLWGDIYKTNGFILPNGAFSDSFPVTITIESTSNLKVSGTFVTDQGHEGIFVLPLN